MKLTKKQRAERGNGLWSSASWLAKLLLLASWAGVADVLLGPKHDFFLMQVHAWMVATPADQVLMQAHSLFVAVAVECVKVSLLLGFGQRLLAVVTPAAEQAKQQFNASLA